MSLSTANQSALLGKLKFVYDIEPRASAYFFHHRCREGQ